MLGKLKWLRHASFLYDGDKKVYFDPWQIGEGLPKADLILISHSHFDHLDIESIQKLSQDSTVIAAPEDEECKEKLSGYNLVAIKPGETKEVEGVKIEAIPAYNIDKFRTENIPFHPKPNNGVGYIATISGTRIYHAGDTDKIPEMKEVNCDIALLPVGGTYTMTVDEAAEAVKDINAQVFVPMHYGYVVGAQEDGQKFVNKVGDKAKLLQPKIPFEK